MTFAKRFLASYAKTLWVTTARAEDRSAPKPLPLALWRTYGIPSGAKPIEP